MSAVTDTQQINPSKDQKITFHMAEFTALKGEMAELTKSTSSYFQYALVGSGGIFTWVMTTKDPGVGEALMFPVVKGALGLVWWLPAILSGLFALLSIAAVHHIGRMGHHLRLLEDQFAFPTFGWERAVRWRVPLFGTIHFLAWAVLIVGDVVLAITLPVIP